MSKEIESIQVYDSLKRSYTTVTKDMACRIWNGYQYTWGKVVKITDGWKGTIYVNTFPHGLDNILKFDTLGYLRSNDEHTKSCATFHSHDEKISLQNKERLERERVIMMNALHKQTWVLNSYEQIATVYNAAVSAGIISIDKPIPV
jgi:hypothetical protein